MKTIKVIMFDSRDAEAMEAAKKTCHGVMGPLEMLDFLDLMRKSNKNYVFMIEDGDVTAGVDDDTDVTCYSI